MTTDMTIARTILQQLGGERFKMMTGASGFSGGERELTFRLKASMTRNRGGAMRITLQPGDTYHLELMRIVKFECRTIDSREGVYVGMLRSVFEEMTGLRTSLAA